MQSQEDLQAQNLCCPGDHYPLALSGTRLCCSGPVPTSIRLFKGFLC